METTIEFNDIIAFIKKAMKKGLKVGVIFGDTGITVVRELDIYIDFIMDDDSEHIFIRSKKGHFRINCSKKE